jgi:hypothetical protein
MKLQLIKRNIHRPLFSCQRLRKTDAKVIIFFCFFRFASFFLIKNCNFVSEYENCSIGIGGSR